MHYQIGNRIQMKEWRVQMIDFIKNGVTTGGYAPNNPETPQGENIFQQYMNQVWAERKEAYDKNLELLKDTDLSKVDPRDRPAVTQAYNEFRNLAMNPPQGTRRGDYNQWMFQVNQKANDVKNRIGEIKNARENLVNGYHDIKEHLTPEGLKLWNQRLSSPITDTDGNVINYDLNEGERNPEHLADINNMYGEILKQNTSPEKTQIGFYKRKDGKVVQQFAKLTNQDRYINDAYNEYQNNPELNYAINKTYEQYKKANPDSTLSVDDFAKQAASSLLRPQTDWDKHILKIGGIKQTPGVLYNDVDEKVPNDYKITVNGPAKTYAEQQAENLANYHAIMGQIQAAAKSGNKEELDRAGRLLSPVVFGKSFSGDGKENRVQFVKAPDGSVLMKATGSNVWGIPTDKGLNMTDQATWQTLHDSYNNQFIKPTNLKYRIPADQLNPYTKDLSQYESQPIVPGSNDPAVQQYATPGMDEPVSSIITPDLNRSQVNGSLNNQDQQPTPNNGLGRFGKRIKNSVNGLMNWGASSDESNNK